MRDVGPRDDLRQLRQHTSPRYLNAETYLVLRQSPYFGVHFGPYFLLAGDDGALDELDQETDKFVSETFDGMEGYLCNHRVENVVKFIVHP